MIVRYLEDLVGTDREVKGETWSSRRFLLKEDGVGFSFNDTVIHAGTESFFWYANHIESVYCIEGEGELECVATGEVHPIRPGMLYVLNEHDKHKVRAKTDLRLMCVFNPPLTGREVHDENGVYPLIVD